MKSIAELSSLNKSLLNKLYEIDVVSIDQLAGKRSIDLFLQMERKYKDMNLHVLWMLDMAISEAQQNSDWINQQMQI